MTGAEKAGLLVVADAEAALDAVLGPRGLGSDRFELVARRAAGPRPERGRTDRPPRVFGEMVNLLCARDQASAADELERLWNAYALKRRFSLLCGYRLDVFDPHAQTEMLPHICREHSHVLPARNYPRFARAVDARSAAGARPEPGRDRVRPRLP